MRSARNCCKQPRIRNSADAATSGEAAAKTSCITPEPKSGRFTRSPGWVNSSCSISWRTCASGFASAVRWRPSK
jgi:hypothetical protein